MQPKVQLTQNGQELQQTDINTAFAEASAAEDQAIQTFLRLAPFGEVNLPEQSGTNWSPGGYNSPARMIIPWGASSDGMTGTGPSGAPNGTSTSPFQTVSGGAGCVTIAPFRAIIGSRDTY